jgi:hypothetical protein
VSAERERIAELLEDETRSFRSIARELNVSDWLVRKTARELSNDPQPMRQPRSRPRDASAEEVSPLVGWLVFGGIVVAIAISIWAGVHGAPPPFPQSTDSFSYLHEDRKENDET